MKTRSFFNASFHAITDVALVTLALIISAVLWNIPIYSTEFFASCIIYAILTVLLLKAYDIYDIDYIPSREIIISVCLTTFITGVAGCICGIVFSLHCGKPAFAIEAFVFSTAFLLFKWLLITANTLKKYSRKRALFIESATASSYTVRKLRYTSGLIQKSLYVMIDDNDDEEIEALLGIIPNYDCLFVSDNIKPMVRNKLIKKIIFEHKIMFASPEISRACAVFGRFMQFGDIPMVYEKPLGFSNIQKFLKRTFDIVCAAIGIIILSPLFLLCAVAVKLDSPGPIFYKQERLTINKKPFYVYKFRSMRTDAEKNGAMFACENDPRVTRVGKFIRAVRIDEIPQLINILVGDMSFVGPRPERPVFVQEFESNVPDYSLRYIERAGLTGYAQVYGKYNTSTFDKTVMDVLYINKASLMLDLKLILLTLKIIFIRESTEGVYNSSYEKDQNTDEARRQSRNLLFGKQDKKVQEVQPEPAK